MLKFQGCFVHYTLHRVSDWIPHCCCFFKKEAKSLPHGAMYPSETAIMVDGVNPSLYEKFPSTVKIAQSFQYTIDPLCYIQYSSHAILAA